MVLPRALIYVATAAVATIAIAIAGQPAPRQAVSPGLPTIDSGSRIIEINGSKILLTLDAQLERADAVAILQSTGKSYVHWNSVDNKEWTPTDKGPDAFIYRDETFKVARVLRGQLNGDEVTLRGVGGTVANVTMTFSGQEDWAAGSTYLVFLRLVDTPTREGSEKMWAEVDIGQSAFRPNGPGQWVNRANQAVHESQIPAS